MSVQGRCCSAWLVKGPKLPSWRISIPGPAHSDRKTALTTLVQSRSSTSSPQDTRGFALHLPIPSQARPSVLADPPPPPSLLPPWFGIVTVCLSQPSP